MQEYKIDDTYTIQYNNGSNGQPFVLKCLRYGEEWRDLTGDNMVLAMLNKIQDLQMEIENTNAEWREEREWNEYLSESRHE